MRLESTITLRTSTTSSWTPHVLSAFTGACIAIARNAIGFISGLNNIRAHCRDARLNIPNIRTQTEVLQLVADGLQRWLDRRGASLDEEERRIIGCSLQASRAMIEALNEEADHTLKVGCW